MTILMEMGLIHPPVGLNLFVIQGIAPDIKLRNIIWGTLPFIVIMVLGIVLLCLVPARSRCGCPTTSTRAGSARTDPLTATRYPAVCLSASADALARPPARFLLPMP